MLLVFLTTLAQYAVEGYEVEAIDYIIKPITYANVAAVLVGCMITTKYIPRKRHYGFRVALSFVLIGVWMFVGKQYMFPAVEEQGAIYPFIPIVIFSGLFLFSGLSVLFWCYST